MTLSRIFLPAFVLSVVACANHEGMYEPACIAYEGDRIELRAGRFEWQRFTDERKVDEAGKRVPPFPEYPKTGTYRIAAGRLELVTDDNVRLEDWFVVEKAGRRYLLNGKQHKAFLGGGELAKCALELSEAEPR